MSNALYERYRPQVWSEVVGQEKALSLIDRLRQRGSLTGRAFWITGNSGTGKTTIARLIADEVAGPRGVTELASGDLTPQRVSDLARGLKVIGLEKPGRVVIVNQSTPLRDDVVSVLLTILEQIPAHGVWIFTATSDDLLKNSPAADRFLSRCSKLALARRGLCEAFAERAQVIAEKEGLGGKPAKAYQRLAKDNSNNLRAMLSAIDDGAMMLRE